MLGLAFVDPNFSSLPLRGETASVRDYYLNEEKYKIIFKIWIAWDNSLSFIQGRKKTHTLQTTHNWCVPVLSGLWDAVFIKPETLCPDN